MAARRSRAAALAWVLLRPAAAQQRPLCNASLGLSLCPSLSTTCTGTPYVEPADPTCSGEPDSSAGDFAAGCAGYFASRVEAASRDGRGFIEPSMCPPGCLYEDPAPTCARGWRSGYAALAGREGLADSPRPWLACSPNATLDPGCYDACPAGCDLAYDSPGGGPVGVCLSAGSAGNERDACRLCPGFRQPSSYTEDNVTCVSNAPTCADTDGDPYTGEQPFDYGLGCGAGRLVPDPQTVVCDGPDGCSRQQCCRPPTLAEVSAAVENCTQDGVLSPQMGSAVDARFAAVAELALDPVGDWMDGNAELQSILFCTMFVQAVEEVERVGADGTRYSENVDSGVCVMDERSCPQILPPLESPECVWDCPFAPRSCDEAAPMIAPGGCAYDCTVAGGGSAAEQSFIDQNGARLGCGNSSTVDFGACTAASCAMGPCGNGAMCPSDGLFNHAFLSVNGIRGCYSQGQPDDPRGRSPGRLSLAAGDPGLDSREGCEGVGAGLREAGYPGLRWVSHRSRVCDAAGLGALDRGVLETFCAERVRLALNTSCPATEHHHCCSCFSPDFPAVPDDGHCCADCANTCRGQPSSLSEDDPCQGIGGSCDPMELMNALEDLLELERAAHNGICRLDPEQPSVRSACDNNDNETACEDASVPDPDDADRRWNCQWLDPASAQRASATDLLTPGKIHSYCPCRAAIRKMELQGGPERREAADAVQEACYPSETTPPTVCTLLAANPEASPPQAGGCQVQSGGGTCTYAPPRAAVTAEEAEVDGDVCLPDSHPAGGDMDPEDVAPGPCTTGVRLHRTEVLDGAEFAARLASGVTAGLLDPTDRGLRVDGHDGVADCRWALSCPSNATYLALQFRSLDLQDPTATVRLFDGLTVGSPPVVVDPAINCSLQETPLSAASCTSGAERDRCSFVPAVVRSHTTCASLHALSDRVPSQDECRAAPFRCIAPANADTASEWSACSAFRDEESCWNWGCEAVPAGSAERCQAVNSMSSAEAEWRMWGTHSCQQMQDGWQVCTTEGDVNHGTVMANCPYTCGIARGDPPPPCPDAQVRCPLCAICKLHKFEHGIVVAQETCVDPNAVSGTVDSCAAGFFPGCLDIEGNTMEDCCPSSSCSYSPACERVLREAECVGRPAIASRVSRHTPTRRSSGRWLSDAFAVGVSSQANPLSDGDTFVARGRTMLVQFTSSNATRAAAEGGFSAEFACQTL